MDTKKRRAVILVGMLVCAIAIAGYMHGVGNVRIPQPALSVPSVAASAKQLKRPPLKPLRRYLLLKVGGLARIIATDREHNTKLPVYNTLDDVANYCQGNEGSSFEKPVKTLVRVLTYDHVWTAQGMGSTCNPVVQVAALDRSWFGWVPSAAIRPNLALGTQLMLGSSDKLYIRPDGLQYGYFKVGAGTAVNLIGYDATPGEAEYHVRVLSGPAIGKAGWILDDVGLRAGNGYRLGLYESPKIATIENTFGSPGAYADLENQPTAEPTADEDSTAQ